MLLGCPRKSETVAMTIIMSRRGLADRRRFAEAIADKSPRLTTKGLCCEVGEGIDQFSGLFGTLPIDQRRWRMPITWSDRVPFQELCIA